MIPVVSMKLAKPKSSRKSIVVRTTPQPVARATQESSALLAVVGISPAILTETVWALAQGKPRIPPVIPDDVVAITTRRGAKTITEQLLTPAENFGGLTVWQSLRQALLGADAHTDSRLTLYVRQIECPNPVTGQVEFLEDIRSEEQNLAAAEFILKQVREQTVAADRRLIASLAGGRKTMGALLHAAFTHLARPQDRLTHVLVDEPFDGGLQPLFYFPTQPVQKLVARDEKTYLAREARIELAEVPFVPLRVRFPDIATVPTRFRTLVQKYVETFRRDASKPALVALHENPPRVVVDGAVVGLEGQRQLTVIRFLLRANQEKWLGFDPDEELRIEQQEAVEFFKASHGYKPDPNRVRPVFRDMLIRHYKNSKPIPGSEWISGATTEDIKRPLSYWRTALDRTGSTWVPKSRELRFPAFRLVEAS